MSHQISAGTQGSLKQMKATLTFIGKLELLFDTMIAKRLKLSLSDYQKKIDPEFWMVGSEEAISNSAADSVVNVRCTVDLEKKVETKEVRSMFGSMTIKVNKCPLL